MAAIRDRFGSERPCWADLQDSQESLIVMETPQSQPLPVAASQASYGPTSQQLSQEEQGKHLLSQMGAMAVWPNTPSPEAEWPSAPLANGMASAPLPNVMEAEEETPPSFDSHSEESPSEPPQKAQPLSSRLSGWCPGDAKSQGQGPALTPTRRARQKRSGPTSTSEAAEPTPHSKRARRKGPGDKPTAMRHGMPIHPMPEASEEDWERRLKKRRSAVDAIKAKQDYRAMAAARAEAENTNDFPSTPEVNDTTMSKRAWEASIMKWRDELKPWAAPPAA